MNGKLLKPPRTVEVYVRGKTYMVLVYEVSYPK